jgi:GNAT superfamily N-acetyltransferase
MRILAYDEIERKETVLPVFYRAFGHPFDPWHFEERRREESRIWGRVSDAFCAVDGDSVAGLVGVVDLPTRTLQGEEYVGGLWSVITHPAYYRQGVATALMERAHEHFKERGIRLVFLTTNRSWGAYNLYRDLGYVDVPWPGTLMAYKVVPPGKRGQIKDLPAASEGHVLEIFRRYTADRTGFVLRHSGFLEAKAGHMRLKEGLCLETDNGYVLASENRGGVDIREMVALNAEAQNTLLSALEGKGSCVVDRWVTSELLMKGYRQRGYLFSEDTYDVLMVKALKPGVGVEKLYGDAFHISRLEPL